MPKKRFSLEIDKPTRVEITWDGGWFNVKNNITIKCDNIIIGSFQSRPELEKGQEFQIQDGALLKVQLISNEFEIFYNGQSVRKIAEARNLHSRLIILLCFVTCLLLALVISWQLLKETRTQPSRLLQPPSRPESIFGMTNVSFWDVVLTVRGNDGNLYDYDGLEWRIRSTVPDRTDDTECVSADVQYVQASVGTISECRQIHTWGEFCPSPTIFVAITQNGDLWRTERFASCNVLFVIPTIICLSFLGFLIGVAIVALRWFIRERQL